jgi:predicted glycogen debranching enzyme
VGAPLSRALANVFAETVEYLRSQDPGPSRSPAVRVLSVAAEQFCLDQSDPPVLTPGYPSHVLHVRDVLIALPGILLAHGVAERAKGVLSSLLERQRGGLLPELLVRPEGPRPKPCPDATLWLFEAARALVQLTGIRDDFVRDRLYPSLVRAFARLGGSRRSWVWRAADGLIVADVAGVALTWMDATIGGSPVTPRTGVAIEHQALWTRAADLLATLASAYGHVALATRASQSAALARTSFRARFWSSDTEYAYDCVSEGRDRADAWSDASVRPNAQIALALDPTLFEGWQIEAILQRAQTELVTPLGVRSLAPSDRRFMGHFGGEATDREAAYHQGTAWTHLLGVYARVARQHWGDEPGGREALVKLLEHVVDAAPLYGQLPQLSDGDAPFRARGSPAQATAVAEVLRALVELGG